MIHVLIDTCSWQNLLMDEVENNLLLDLNRLVTECDVQLVTHEIIKDEWSLNQEKELIRLSKAVSTRHRHARRVISELNHIPISIAPNTTHIQNQIATINSLIAGAIVLSTSDTVKIICNDKSLNKKAPYHNEPRSDKDARIIYSAIEYFKKEAKEFYFISHNKNDFADLNSKQDKIHPDILEGFTDFKINYYIEIGRAISELKKEFGLNLIQTTSSQGNQISDTTIAIDTSKSKLDQLYDYFQKMFAQFQYVPIELLLNSVPLKNNPRSSYPYYSLFTLYLEDDNLFPIFESLLNGDERVISVAEANFKGYDDVDSNKISFILKTLRSNLIYHISHKDFQNNEIEIGAGPDKDCNCSKCSFRRLEFTNYFQGLSSYEKTPEDLIEQGYFFYKSGNFVRAIETFEEAHKISFEASQFSFAFISKFNLSKLASFIGNFWLEIPNWKELLKKLNKINVDSLVYEYGKPENRELLQWIAKEKFFTISYFKIQKITGQIIEQYYSSLNKGRSSNSHVWKLISYYAECISFLEANKIVFDQFSEFYQLNKTFTEGLFASHAIKNPHNAKLSSFSDWILRQLVFNGDADHMLKIAKRYRLSNIAHSSDENADSFTNLTDNFFTHDSKMWSELDKVQTHPNRFFKNYYNKLYANLLVLLSLCELDKKYINDLVPKLIEFHQNEDVINRGQIKYMKIFIASNKSLLTLKNLRFLFKKFLPLDKFHDERILESICEILVSRNSKIILSKNDYSRVLNLAFDKCEMCQKKHPITIIVPILRAIVKETQRREIIQKISDLLNQSFNFDLYYQAQIYDLIPNQKKWFELAIKECIPEKINKRPAVFIFDDAPIHEPLNDLINLCLKNEINLKRKPFLKAKLLSPYYNWLLAMKDFDYAKFEIEWIREYSTRFYYRQMADCIELRNAIEKYLRSTIDRPIEKCYLDIYIRRAWETR